MTLLSSPLFDVQMRNVMSGDKATPTGHFVPQAESGSFDGVYHTGSSINSSVGKGSVIETPNDDAPSKDTTNW